MDPLISLLENYWREEDNDIFSLEPTEGDEYIVYTNSIDGLGNGISFYLTPHANNTFSLNDRVLTANHINQKITNFERIKLPSARLAATYGLLLNERGEFVNQEIKADQLSTALNNFAEFLLCEINLAKSL
ncbi:hypothetical protein [Lactobacillus sp.]|uniref:hypothetical protein n=1 Tax=Lactobacillus sp. TaxID=1591 RepID=UPI00199BF0DE|nr:hypothetical protein [Lactobacillus sp.]MBD5429160.1 DUF1828 domain-containing protein [Lactobacillus sp.]